DPADQQGSEANEGQELSETADGAFELRRGIAAAAHLPTGLRRGSAGIVDQRSDRAVIVRVLRQPHPIDPANEAAGLHEAGRVQGIDADQKPRAEAEAAGELV